MSQLFGYSLERAKKGQGTGPSFVRKESDDAATPVAGGGYFGTAIDLDGTFKDENDLIWRTVGVSTNIIDASVMALSDGMVWKLMNNGTADASIKNSL